VKPFDPAQYEADDNAKYVVLHWLNHNMPSIETHRINPDPYGIDIIGGIGGVEVEIRHAWSGPNWPFPDVRIPIRKRKFIDPTLKTWFVIVNNERTHGIVIAGTSLFNAPVKEIDVPLYNRKELFMVVSPGIIIDLTQFSDRVSDTVG